MIERYTRPEIGAVWTDEARMEAWRRVEVAACEEMPGLAAGEREAIRAATFTVEAVKDREKVTDHDVAAFVDVLSASAGPAGRWIHFGLTSSDVLDTCLNVQLVRAADILIADVDALLAALKSRALEHKLTPTIGRSRGIHAEPVTFGLKLAQAYAEFERNRHRLVAARKEVATCAISGAVGTFANIDPRVEQYVAEKMGLTAEPVSTQVIPRDRHAMFFATLGVVASSIERLAIEIRHLQRTEVLEAEEYFAPGQKGSSAMPHKRNPIVTERITGIARLLRGYAQAGLENVALWHERDISHSGAERVALPDASILLDYAHSLAVRVVEGMTVHEDRMRANLDLTSGALFSQRALLALVETGMSRDDAYRIVQRLAQQAWDTQTPLRDLLAAEPAAAALDLDAIFDYAHYLRHVPEVMERLDAILVAG